MATLGPRNLVEIAGMRRLAHVMILVGVIVAVRACGGALQAEDRLSATSRWIADKTGLTEAKTAWDTRIRPPIATVANRSSEATYAVISRSLDSLEAAADGVAGWVAEQVTTARDAAWNSIRSVLTPKPEPIPPQPAPAKEQETPTR